MKEMSRNYALKKRDGGILDVGFLSLPKVVVKIDNVAGDDKGEAEECWATVLEAGGDMSERHAFKREVDERGRERMPVLELMKMVSEGKRFWGRRRRSENRREAVSAVKKLT